MTKRALNRIAMACLILFIAQICIGSILVKKEYDHFLYHKEVPEYLYKMCVLDKEDVRDVVIKSYFDSYPDSIKTKIREEL